MTKYLKPASELGYIEDSAVIEYEKFNNLRHTILGCMMGDFNESGLYVVSPEITKELISMPKYITDSLDNIDLCLSCLKLDKQISFMVVFDANRASLVLVEKINYEANFKINSGVYSNINEYVLDSVETSGQINREVIYQRWNISQFKGEVLDIFNCDPEMIELYFGIVNRFKYLMMSNKILLEKESEIEELESEYVLNIFEILKHYPKLETEVDNELLKILGENKHALCMDKPNFSKTLNEVMESILAKKQTVLSEEEKQEFLVEKHNLLVEQNIKRRDVLSVEKEQSQKPTKTVESALGLKAREEMIDGKLTTVSKESVAVLKLKTNEQDQNKSVSELAQEFVSAQKAKQSEQQTVVDSVLDNKKTDRKLTGVIQKLISLGVVSTVLMSKQMAEQVVKKQKEKQVEQMTETTIVAPVKAEKTAVAKQAGSAKSAQGGDSKSPKAKKSNAPSGAKAPKKAPEVKKTPTKTDEQTNDVPIIPNGIGVIPKLVPRRAEEIQREKRTKFAYNVSRELNILEGEKNTADAETQKRKAEQSSDLEI